MISRRVKNPLTPSVSWRVSDWSFDVSSLTNPNRESTRDSESGMAPVAVSITVRSTYTGRKLSSASLKRGRLIRLRSVVPVWLTPRAKDASSEMLTRWSNSRRLTPNDPRHALGAPKSGSKTVTLGSDVRDGAGGPSQSVGMDDSSLRYDDHSGVGTDDPMHTS